MYDGYLNFNGYLNFSGYLYGCGYLYGSGYVYGGSYLYAGQQPVLLQGAVLQAQGKVKEAAEAYAEDARKLPESPAALYRNLLRFVQQELDGIAASRTAAGKGRPSGGRTAAVRPPLLISVPVWGRDYIGSLDSLMLRTLLAPGNLPAVAGGRPIILELQTRESDARRIESLPALRDVARLATVRIVPWPDRLFAPHPLAPDFHYRLFGAMHHCAIMRARAAGGMDVMPLCADHIFSSAALGQIDAYLAAGRKMVLSAGLRLDKRRWTAALLGALNGRATLPYLELAPRRLVDDAIRHMHPVTRQLIVADPDRPFNSLPFPLIFPKPDGFAVHSFVLHPIAISAGLVRRSAALDFNTVDGAFLSRILPHRRPEKQIAVLGCDDEAYVFEASEPGNMQERQLAPSFSTEQIARYFYDWRSGRIEDLYKLMFRTQIRFRAEEERFAACANDLDEDTVVGDILAHIAGWEGGRSGPARRPEAFHAAA
jgi:hypothetical protein